MGDPATTPAKAACAPVEPPSFNVAVAHANIQKGYRGSTAGSRNPDPATTPLLDYLDELRDDLVAATMAHQERPKELRPRGSP